MKPIPLPTAEHPGQPVRKPRPPGRHRLQDTPIALRRLLKTARLYQRLVRFQEENP